MTAPEPIRQTPPAPVGRSPLYREDWEYIEKTDLLQFTRADYATLQAQRTVYDAERQAAAALALLTAGEHEPTFGYQINNYQHCLQAATMLHADGYDEETIVVGLLHDVGFLACPDRHGAFAAELLGGYVSDENYWMLRHHQAFATFAAADDEAGPGVPLAALAGPSKRGLGAHIRQALRPERDRPVVWQPPAGVLRANGPGDLQPQPEAAAPRFMNLLHAGGRSLWHMDAR